MASKSEWPARVWWLAAFLGPPAAAIGVWRHFAAHHPAVAVVLVVTYETVIAAARFAGGVTGEVAKRWQRRLADSLDLALQRRISRFDRRYRAFVLAGLRFIDQKGLATVGPFNPELDDIFVDVSLASRPPHMVKEGLLADLPADVTERRALSEFLDSGDPVVLAVIGAPGSGKTTLLRHTARQICRRPRGRGQGRHLPILLYLRDHAAAIVADPDVTLTGLVRSTLGGIGAAEHGGWFEQQLRDGECVVLLDGLDEVAEPEDRKKVATWAERQIRQYPANDYVITSRPHGYRAAEIDGANVLQVRGFTTEQVARFVRGWYLAAERHSTGVADEDITIRARRQADDLLQRLARAPALYDLTVNPLLLTMIANVHHYRGALPGSRADLYAEICQVMLFRRQEAKNLPVQLAGDKKEALLRGLAYEMMQRRLSDLPKDDVLAEIKPGLRRLPRRITTENFLADVGTTGLLIERETGLYCFPHQTFQEYLAAAYIRDKGLADVLAKAVDDPWWRETTLLYAAWSDADPIVAACLDLGTITALTLAFDCADQGSGFAEDLRDRLESLLTEVSDPGSSPERRRLIIGVLFTRHLHQQIRASNGTRICTRPITTGLYQLFCDDTHIPPPDSPPLTVAVTEPAAGIRGSDAAAFVRWVNTIIGGEAAYHLPSRTALDDPAVQRLINSAATDPPRTIWIEPGDAMSELWVPAGARHPHEIDITTLTAHLNSDMIRSVPTLARLLVLRSALAVSVFASYLTQTVDRARDLDRDLALPQILDRARHLDLVRDLGFARDLARYFDVRDPALDRALVRDLDLALDLTRALDRAEALDRALDRGQAFGRALGRSNVRDADRDLAIDLAQVLARALNGALNLARDLDLARDRARAGAVGDHDHHLALDIALALDLDRDLDLDRHRDIGIHCLVMGSALSRALLETLRDTRQASDWPAKFSRAFTDAVGISGNSYVVSPDTLSERLINAVQALQATQAPHGKTSESSWVTTVSRRLQETATPVFDRQQKPTPDIATPIRLAALCLAAEADVLDERQLGEEFRNIAVGVTLLERRTNGDNPVTEMILLASE